MSGSADRWVPSCAAIHRRVRRLVLRLVPAWVIATFATSATLASLSLPGAAQAGGFSVIREVTTLEVRRTGHYTETVERTLRIDSPAGIDDHDQWSLTYNPQRSKLEILQAWTQTPTGQRIPVPSSRVVVRERAKSDRDYLFSGRRSLVVIHPGLEVGSLVHVHWRATHAPIHPGHFALRRPLDPNDPPRAWTLRLIHEPGMPIRVHRVGLTGGQLGPDDRGWMQYEFRVDKEEITRSSKLRRAAPEGPWLMLAFSTYPSWAEVAKAYRVGADPQAAVTPTLRAHAREVTQGARNARERARHLHDWVRRNIRYVSVEGDRGTTFPAAAEQILHNCYGDCKDKSALLQALLAAVGIPAQTVLINDGWWVELPSLPTPYFFSHVMVHVPSLGLYLDPTDSELPMGVLDRIYVDKPVLHVGTAQPGRTPASSPERDGAEAETIMEMRPDGSVYGSSRTRLTGHPQVNWRYELADSAKADLLVARVLASRGEWGSGSAQMVSEESDPALEASMTFELKPVVDLPGPTLLRIPSGAFPSGMSRYIKPTEVGPQACHSERHREKLSLTLPRGHSIEGKFPAAVNFSRGALMYRSHYAVVRDGAQTRVEVSRELVARCAARVLSNEDRLHLDELRDVLARDFRAQVVVK